MARLVRQLATRCRRRRQRALMAARLAVASSGWEETFQELSAARSFTVEQRQILSPPLRRDTVDGAALYGDPPVRVVDRLVLAAVNVTVMVAVPLLLTRSAWILLPNGFITISYLVGYLLVAAWVFHKPSRQVTLRIALASLVLIATLAWSVRFLPAGTDRYPWSAGGFLAVYGAFGLLLAWMLCAQADMLYRRYLGWPRTSRGRRRSGNASEGVAMVLTRLVLALEKLDDSAWRRAEARGEATRLVRAAAWDIERHVPYLVAAAGAGKGERQRTMWLCRHAAAVVRRLGEQFAATYDQETYRQLCAQVTRAAAGVVRDDWRPMTLEVEPPRRAYRRWAVAALPAAACGALALAVPVLPQVRSQDVTSFRTILIIAAATGLLRLDSGTRDTVTQAYRDATSTH